MKIENSLFASEIQRLARGAGQSSSRETANFSDLLAKAVANENVSDGSQLGCQTVGEVSPPPAPESQPPRPTPPLWSELNGLLDSLDSYAQALGNPTWSLKELEPLAQDLEAKADQLEQGLAAQQLGGAGNLAGLMQEVLAQARVESIKFRRGDYV
ncbi:MAG: hypothetical protein LDL11_05065 [Desulfarculus sp.]|nr:hypothetical protein [Desulfarculus sp.]